MPTPCQPRRPEAARIDALDDRGVEWASVAELLEAVEAEIDALVASVEDRVTLHGRPRRDDRVVRGNSQREARTHPTPARRPRMALQIHCGRSHSKHTNSPQRPVRPGSPKGRRRRCERD